MLRHYLLVITRGSSGGFPQWARASIGSSAIMSCFRPMNKFWLLILFTRPSTSHLGLVLGLRFIQKALAMASTNIINASRHNVSSFPSKSIALPPMIVNALNGNNERQQQSSAGKIKRLVLSQEGRTKLNLYPDREFYAYPRFVTHVDDGFISTLTNLYRERLRPDSEILDLMSSWISHLPKEVRYKRVVGHGLNAQELANNPRLDYFFVKDLNADQKLELESGSFDAVLCTVSVQYLQQPEKVFAEVFRVLRPGGVFIVSFSNRMFYEKAISAWRDGSAYSRVQLVVQYFQAVEGFTQPEIVRKLTAAGASQEDNRWGFSWIPRLMGLLSGSDPFYAVIAHKNFKPAYSDN